MFKNQFRAKVGGFFLVGILNAIVSSTQSWAQNIYVFDINDTITLINAVDPEKTTDVVLYQLVAQNLEAQFKGKTVSLEALIKSTVSDKTTQRETYKRIPKLAAGWKKSGILNETQFTKIPVLYETFKSALQGIPAENLGLFTSFKKVLEEIQLTDPSATILFQSFGEEIPLALRTVKSWFPSASVDLQVHEFDDQGNLTLKTPSGEEKVGTSDRLLSLLKPRTFLGWRTNYKAWRAGIHGKFLFYFDSGVKTFFFDDNAKICRRVIWNQKTLSKEVGDSFADSYTLQVNTGSALTDEAYFVKAIRHFLNPIPRTIEHYPVPALKSDDNTITVLSYNIQLSRLDEPGHKWSYERKAPVIELIKAQAPDLIGLQEVSGLQFGDLKQAFPEYSIQAINTVTGELLAQTAPEDQEGLIILFKRSKFDFVKEEHWWLSETPTHPSRSWGTQFNKLTQKLTLKEVKSNRLLSFYNSHFPHDGAVERVNPRQKSAEIELANMLKDIKEGIAPISVGDRNFHFPRDAGAYGVYLKTLGLSDATVMNQFGANSTFIGYESHPRINEVTSEGRLSKNCVLDLIFFGSSLLKNIQTHILLGEYNEALKLFEPGLVRSTSKRRFASDHSAVVSQFVLINQK